MNLRPNITRFLKASFKVVNDILRRPSLAFLTVALLSTYLGKMFWLLSMNSESRSVKMGFLAFFAEDLLFFSAIFAFAWIIENLFNKRAVWVLTTFLLAIVSVFSILNAVLLNKTGFQFTRHILVFGLTRFVEIKPILAYEISIPIILKISAVILFPVALCLVFRAKWKKDKQPSTIYKPTIIFPLISICGTPI